MASLFLIFIALLLVFMNAFFVAAEFALVKIRQTRVALLRKKYRIRGFILFNVSHHMDAYLSACQLGVTLASLGLGWVSEPAFSHVLTGFLTFSTTLPPHLISLVSFVLVFGLISFLHIVLGELLPKSLSMRRSEQIALWTAVPLYIFYWMMYPIIWLLNSCSNRILRLTGLDSTHKGEYFYSTDEIKMILSTSHLHGELTKDEAAILEHTLDFADLNVTEVMRPIVDMITLSLSQTPEMILQTVMKHRYSRYPVFDKKNERIIGILHVKDLFAHWYQGKAVNSIKSLLRPILKISQRIPALDVLRQFRSGAPHFALVYRKHELLGFVTLDNLLHVLLGRIQDEFHRTKDDWTVYPDGSISIQGEASIFSLERALNREITVSSEKIETVGGLILDKVGALPRVHDRIDFAEFIIVVEKIRGHRLMELRVIPKTASEPEAPKISP